MSANEDVPLYDEVENSAPKKEVNTKKVSLDDDSEGQEVDKKPDTVLTMPWLFGKITREQEAELLQGGEPGLFLVRESTNYPGDYTLSVCSPEEKGKVEHYRVLTRKGLLTIDEDIFFTALPDLVDHYTKDSDGLCTNLKQP